MLSTGLGRTCRHSCCTITSVDKPGWILPFNIHVERNHLFQTPTYPKVICALRGQYPCTRGWYVLHSHVILQAEQACLLPWSWLRHPSWKWSEKNKWSSNEMSQLCCSIQGSAWSSASVATFWPLASEALAVTDCLPHFPGQIVVLEQSKLKVACFRLHAGFLHIIVHWAHLAFITLWYQSLIYWMQGSIDLRTAGGWTSDQYPWEQNPGHAGIKTCRPS